MKILFTTLICLLLAFAVKAQIIYNDEGEQIPFALTDKYKNLIDLSKIKTCTLKSYNNDSLYAKYNKDNVGEDIRAGIPIDTLINIKTKGTKFQITQGTLWLYKIESKTAEMLNVDISISDLPDGAYICIFPKKEQLYMRGPRFFYKKDIIKQNVHRYLYGNQLLIEYFEPNGSHGPKDINITKIAYIFTTPFKNHKSGQNENKLKSGYFGNALNGCQFNVVCPEVSSWAKESRSIIYIFIGYYAANGLFTHKG
jgi:hypothetical protein